MKPSSAKVCLLLLITISMAYMCLFGRAKYKDDDRKLTKFVNPKTALTTPVITCGKEYGHKEGEYEANIILLFPFQSQSRS